MAMITLRKDDILLVCGRSESMFVKHPYTGLAGFEASSSSKQEQVVYLWWF